MKILVFGAGAIGSAFGGFLSPFHDVTLLGRPRHLETIRKRGLRVEGIWGNHRFSNFHLAVDAASLFRSKPVFHLILITVKSYDTVEAARFLQGKIGGETLLLSLQNGIGNVEILHRFLPPRQVLAGRVITGVEMEPGKIRVTVTADKIRLGETTVKRVTPRVKTLARIFSKGGLPATAVADVQKYLWAKLIYNCVLNPLASLLGVPYGTLSEWGSTRFLMDEIIREAYRVAARKRVKLDPPTAEGYRQLFYRKLVPETYGHHPSMLQDLRQGKQTEIEAMNGELVRLGRAVSISTPFNRLLTELIYFREER